MNLDTAHRHIAAADLIRLLDGELATADRASAEHALAVCDVCREHAARLRHRTARLTLRLDEADWTAPSAAEALARLEAARSQRGAALRWSGAQQPRLRLAAAIALVVLGGALAVSPAAAWLGRALERAWHALTTSEASTVEPAPPSLQEPVEVRAFAPAAGVFTVRFARAEDAVLELSASTDTSLVVDVRGAAVAEVLQEERQLRIDNQPAGRGRTYRITIPTQVSQVRVIVGDAAPVVFSRAQLAAGVTRSLEGER